MKEVNNKCVFKIRIFDGFVWYEYKLEISRNESIDSVARRIYNAHGIKFKEGIKVK